MKALMDLEGETEDDNESFFSVGKFVSAEPRQIQTKQNKKLKVFFCIKNTLKHSFTYGHAVIKFH